MPSYTIARTAFPRKADAEKRIQEILHTSPIGQHLAGADLRLVLGVLAKHPRADEKLRGGIVAITVALNSSDTGLSARGFQIVRPDGTYVTFSYRRALGNGAPKGVDEAARFAIAEALISFKQKAFGRATHITCAITGRLVSFEDSDIHHAEPWPFKSILDAFIEQNGEPEVRKRQNGHFGSEFVYPKDTLKFCQFHDSLAILQIVSRDAHYRLRHAQLSDIGSEDSDNGEAARADLTREFPPA